MLKIITLICFGCLVLGQGSASGQALRQRTISTLQDTIVLDTLSIVPGTVAVKTLSGDIVFPSAYRVVDAKALLIWLHKPPFPEARITYKVFPVLFSQKYFNKDPKLIGETTIDNTTYLYTLQKE